LALGLGTSTARFSVDAFLILNIQRGFALNCSGQERKPKIQAKHEGQYHIFLDAESIMLGGQRNV
jgi:hypothetical protein